MRFHPDTVQTRMQTPLGEVALAATPRGLAGLWFSDQRWRPAELDGIGAWPRHDGHPLLRDAAAAVHAYFDGASEGFEALPLDIEGGTPFQQQVWRALAAVPRGGTQSYGALAAQLGRPAAVRAVGAAVGRNPLCVVLPCHRVLGASGALTGYAGGLERKRALLLLEGALS